MTFAASIQNIELIWTGIAVFGGLFAAHNLFLAVGDYIWTRRRGIFNGRRIAAKGTVAIESARFIIQSIFIVIGVLAMTLPAAPETPNEPTDLWLFHNIFQYGMVLASALLASNTIVTAYMRHKLAYGKPHDSVQDQEK